MAPLRALTIDDDTNDCALLRHHLKRMARDARVPAEPHRVAAVRKHLGRNDDDEVFLDCRLAGDAATFVAPGQRSSLASRKPSGVRAYLILVPAPGSFPPCFSESVGINSDRAIAPHLRVA